MIVLAAALLGIFLGVMTARRRKGTRLDLLHFGAIYGIVFALFGLVATVVIEQLVV